MTASDIQCRLEVYLELRRSLGFVVCYEAYALKELLRYIQAKGVTVQTAMVVDFAEGGGWALAGAGDGSEPQSVNS